MKTVNNANMLNNYNKLIEDIYNNNIKDLKLNDNYINKNELVKIFDAILKNSSIMSISIFCVLLNSKIIRKFSKAIKSHKQIQYLEINNCGLKKSDIIRLVKAVENHPTLVKVRVKI